MRVLVTGAGGLLGGRLATLLAASHEVVAARHTSPVPSGLPEVLLDLLSPASLEGAIEAVRPDVLVHSAALADADLCEREPDLAERCNVAACEVLARACRRRGVRLIALSTDLVLRGDRAFAGEGDETGGSLVYARTKLRGEEAVLDEAPGSAVLRVALIHGRGHGPRATASEAAAWRLARGDRLRLFIDQFRTPVDAESVASAIVRLLEGDGRGRYHLGGLERLSRYHLGLGVACLLGLPSHLIEATTQAVSPMGVRRPADCSLDSGRAQRELGWRPRPLDSGILEGRRRPEGAAG